VPGPVAGTEIEATAVVVLEGTAEAEEVGAVMPAEASPYPDRASTDADAEGVADDGRPVAARSAAADADADADADAADAD
jgi:hypothetical protein